MQISILLLLFVSISCNKSTPTNSLECIINNYINFYHIKRSDNIYIGLYEKWSDTTSILDIVYINKGENVIFPPKYYKTKYDNIDIYLSGDTNLNYLPINSFFWEEQTLHKDTINRFHKNYNNIQIVYNPSKKCIEEIIKGVDSLQIEMRRSCTFCR